MSIIVSISFIHFTHSDTLDLAHLGHDFPPTFPLHSGTLSDVHLTMEESTNFPLTSWASNDQWFTIAPLSAGYVCLGPHVRLFVVMMFHGLHCMRILNLAFDPLHIIGDGHINHCLGYLHQMTLCSADLTVEPAGWKTRDFSWDRVGAMHKCWDWSAVYVEVEQNYAQWNCSQT
ncbi:hypothetical protein BDN71DRAFT_1402301 [Pleurotus eryngii]|uniref:Uncharacterized protein n=1 Tax=Pleurotus eryngii TaxID=5323 RepID=A0A9P5ZKP0_PLEER|nr:hypothetical protein BDN71DRAFT_1402301 [Pleurotus eryngii]